MLAIEVPLGVAIASAAALGGAATLLLSSLFAPNLRYDICWRRPLPNDSEDFLNTIESLTDAKANVHSRFQVLTNGPAFYEAELTAIRSAQRNISLEAYIFNRGSIGDLFLEALTERASAGVQVEVVLDAFGSLGVTRSYFERLLQHGGKVTWYNGPKWYRITHLDNRTHRELLIVDGTTAFIGGAGIADQWWIDAKEKPRWRDTVVRVEGDAVTNLQATFAENWLESCGEVLAGTDYFPAFVAVPESLPSQALIVNSSPTNGGSTRARILFQLLLASARSTIHITNPYFLPDASMQEEMIRAMQERGVEVKVIVPGKKSDHLLTRSASRLGYGNLLRAGAQVFEYEPSMIHAKILIVDGLWSIVGSTNFDNRSFGINDEVNMAVRSRGLADRLEADFQSDLARSRQMSYAEWRRRPLAERIPELLGWVIQHQQ